MLLLMVINVAEKAAALACRRVLQEHGFVSAKLAMGYLPN